MLSQLFPRLSREYQSSCFGPGLEEFSDWLQKTGYSKRSIRGHVHRLFRVLSRSKKIKPGAARSRTSLHHTFGRCCTTVEHSQYFRATEQAYGRFLRDQGRLIEEQPSDAVSLLLARYQRYLADVRGLTESTAANHQRTIAGFLKAALRSGKRVAALTGEDVERYVAKRSKQLTRQTLQNVVAHLRAFLRYGFANGLVKKGLDVIDTPRTYRDELPPRALPWGLVKKLLRSVDRSSKAGWRDYMMLHLMAYYGLRASEIVALRLDSIDWQAKTCHVEQRKTQSDLILPLSERTLGLLRRYLRHGRAECPLPPLFLRVRRPLGALGDSAPCSVFYKRADQSGLPLEGYSSYCLRHGFAMRLFQRRVGVKAIGDLLGHRSLEATCVYLRLDTSVLRAVALPVPQARPGRDLHA